MQDRDKRNIGLPSVSAEVGPALAMLPGRHTRKLPVRRVNGEREILKVPNKRSPSPFRGG